MKTTRDNLNARNERQNAANTRRENNPGKENENEREIAHLFNSLDCVTEDERPADADRDEKPKEQKPVQGVHIG